MANLYGVSNPIIIPISMTVPAGSVACAAGVETMVVQCSALAAISSGVYYPQIFGSLGGNITSTGITTVNFYARITGGSDFVTLPFSGQQFTNGVWFALPVTFVGPASTIPWQGAGTGLQVWANFGGGTAIIYQGSTNLWATLYRAPDQ